MYRVLFLTLLTVAALVPLSAAPIAAQAPALDLANRPAVDGISRTTLRNDERVTVTRVHFAPGAAEPVHTHPFDIMVMPIQSGAAELIVGSETISYLKAGEVYFIARDVPHQLANTSGEPFEVVAVSLR